MPFAIGPGELVIVLVILLVLVGPGRLPQVGSAVGRSLHEFRTGLRGEASSAPDQGRPERDATDA